MWSVTFAVIAMNIPAREIFKRASLAKGQGDAEKDYIHYLYTSRTPQYVREWLAEQETKRVH